MTGTKPVSFPMEQNHKLALDDSDPLDNPGGYSRLIGKLIYLTITRPELCYSVHILGRPALRVLPYLKSSPGQGIFFSSKADLSLRAYCDSDWASCPLTRHSITGYFILLGDSPMSWKTKKQTTSLDPRLKSNTVLWPLLLVKLYDFALYLRISQSITHTQLNFFVTIALPYTLPPIPFIMSALNIEKSIAILFETVSSLVSLRRRMFPPIFNLPTFLPKPLATVSFSFWLANWAFVISMLISICKYM
ncbi:UNVERIFIED_CONTAM: putative mitochondrial protein [Sesamum radiatum]|uniref:Mitochondrial protein n=1 Tax=Sesamum radiatum TaxID=300843 RepID=A0AAW2VRX6_SESRA